MSAPHILAAARAYLGPGIPGEDLAEILARATKALPTLRAHGDLLCVLIGRRQGRVRITSAVYHDRGRTRFVRVSGYGAHILMSVELTSASGFEMTADEIESIAMLYRYRLDRSRRLQSANRINGGVMRFVGVAA